MKEFTLQRNDIAAEGNITKQVLEFLIYDGDSKFNTLGFISDNDVLNIIRKHNLEGFMLARGYKKIVSDQI